jgi:hypothetical protein
LKAGILEAVNEVRDDARAAAAQFSSTIPPTVRSSVSGNTKVESDEIVELKAILPEFKGGLGGGVRRLDALPDFTGALAAVQTDVASVKAKVDQAPLVDRQAVEGIVKSLVIPNVLTPATAPVAAPLAEPAAP